VPKNTRAAAMNLPPGHEAEALREVERDYGDALRSLTFNNKPQIDALSQIADDHKFAAPVIVRLIERGLREVSTPDPPPPPDRLNAGPGAASRRLACALPGRAQGLRCQCARPHLGLCAPSCVPASVSAPSSRLGVR